MAYAPERGGTTAACQRLARNRGTGRARTAMAGRGQAPENEEIAGLSFVIFVVRILTALILF